MPLHAPEWHLDHQGAEATLCLGGDWISQQTGLRTSAETSQLVDQAGKATQLSFDSTGVGKWDSALVAFICSIRDAAAQNPEPRIQLDPSGLPEAAQKLLALAIVETKSPSLEIKPVSISFPARIGQHACNIWLEMTATAELIGQTALRIIPAAMGRTHTRAVDVFQLMREAGAQALGIVALVNGLIGAILAFVGAVELRRFGAGIFVADLVGIAVVREMAAVMTAIVMAGRTGGAYAANLAAMQGNEEIDALKVLGIPIYDYLILPRVSALVTMMPLLYLYGCAFGILGGFIVSVSMLDLNPVAFFEQLQAGLAAKQFVFGFFKSIAFGALVAIAGCRIGLSAGRSATDVGHAATSAVVAGIVGVIALDAVFAVCADALGI